MTIYIDLVIIINFIFDYIVLLITDLLLKRNTKLNRVFLASFFGELSMIILFIKFNFIVMFLLKIIISYIMVIICFKYKSFRYTITNYLYTFLTAFILGGFMYYLSLRFLEDIKFSIKYILLLIVTFIFSFIYYKLISNIKNNYNNRYDVIIRYDNDIFYGKGYLDSANNLTSPYSGKPIIIIEKRYINYERLKLLPVMYNAVNHTGFINCFKPDEVLINGINYNVLIGLSEKPFNMECEILLNNRMGII